MRVLFVLKQLGYIRHFDSVVRELAQRGHIVRLACQDGETQLPESLTGIAGVSAVAWPAKRGDQWVRHASLVRRAGDYLRYLEPSFVGANKLRARAFEKLAGTLSAHERVVTPGMSDAALALTADERDRLRDLVATIERAIPSDPKIEAFLTDEAPDLIVITPLIDLGSGQTDIVKGAAALGIPAAMALFSWDNLTTKGIVHDVPDRILVWNQRQRDEAITFHGVPEDRIRITGAPRFDEFFALTPAASRDAFLGSLGLDRSAPTVLYLGSSKFVAENERTFVERWLSLLRQSPQPSLAGCNVIVKPHPDVNRMWEAADATRITLGSGPTVSALVSRSLNDPQAVVVQGKFTAAQLLYECLAHADAVVALNTSAELEAGILGKSVLTLPAGDDVADGQENTLHYHYLLKEHGGHVERAATMAEHLSSLAAALETKTPAGRSPFIAEFLRPISDGRTPTVVFVDELEALEQSGSQAESRAGTRASPLPRPTSEGDAGGAAQKTRLDYDGCSVWLMVSSPMEAKWRVRACAKEPWTVAWLERLTETNVLYDIGANVGAFSILATKRLANRLRVVAFEPGYATFARLCDNIVVNGCDASILPIANPLWSTTALTAFKYRSLDPGQSRHAMKDREMFRPKHNDRDRATERYVQPMLAVALDDLMRSYSLPVPTHIKLDVDGAEMHVLNGARELLRSSELKSVLIEVDRALVDEVSALMATTGLQQAAVHNREHKAHGPLYFEFARV